MMGPSFSENNKLKPDISAYANSQFDAYSYQNMKRAQRTSNFRSRHRAARQFGNNHPTIHREGVFSTIRREMPRIKRSIVRHRAFA